VSRRRLRRRAFLRVLGGGSLAVLCPRRTAAEETYTIGLVRPPAASSTTPFEHGALLGLEEANALTTLFGKRLRVEMETAADASAAAAAARKLAGRGRAVALLGGAGPGVAGALRDAASAESTVFLNVAAQDDVLRQERCARSLFHVIPSVSMSVDALGQWLAGRQRLARWTVVGDGSARAAEIESAARRTLTRYGGSLVGAGASADVLLLAVDPEGGREALARARSAGRSEIPAGIGWELPSGLAAEAAWGTWAVGWHPELEQFSGRELNGRFRRRFGLPLTDTSWAAWAAVKLIGESLVRGSATTSDQLTAFLEGAPPFDGHKGAALTFRNWDHQLRQPMYVMAPRSRDETRGARGAFAVLAQLPGANLDDLGTAAAETRCRLGS
jgi:ABC-type branched-subunit amino acid transport system substrate-binding protein